MDAVLSFLKREGGSIELVLVGGQEGDDFRPVQIRIALPANLAVQTQKPSFVWQVPLSEHRLEPNGLAAREMATPFPMGLGLQGA